uniref:RNase H type-1 domain-containing protein n=1 Tax=Brassica oleracea var. oleracea TaxID=109376 RepID=A0A0D3ALE5_BRAOL
MAYWEHEIQSFVNSEIVHVPRTENKRADSLARNARQQLSFVVHMDVDLPPWFIEST